MIEFEKISGLKIVKEADVPAAMLDALRGVATVAGFRADELPPGFDAVFGAGPGVTIVMLDEKPTTKDLPMRALIDRVEALGRARAQTRCIGEVRPETDERFVSALLELAATPPGRASEVRKKHRCLRAHVEAREVYPIAREMVEAAILVDAEDWSRGKMGH